MTTKSDSHGTICFPTKQLFYSKAFFSLSKWGHIVLMHFYTKRQMTRIKGHRKKSKKDEWVIANNGEIVYPYSVAEQNGIGRREFRKALDELISTGFLEIAHAGSGGVKGDTHKFRLVDRWMAYGTPEFQTPENPLTKDTRDGRGWGTYHKKRKTSKKLR